MWNSNTLLLTIFTSYKLYFLPGRSTQFWTLYIDILSGPLPGLTAIHSGIFVGLPHTGALYTQSPLSPQSYAPDSYTLYFLLSGHQSQLLQRLSYITALLFYDVWLFCEFYFDI